MFLPLCFLALFLRLVVEIFFDGDTKYPVPYLRAKISIVYIGQPVSELSKYHKSIFCFITKLQNQVRRIMAIVRKTIRHVMVDCSTGFELIFFRSRQLKIQGRTRFDKKMIGLVAKIKLEQGC